MTGLSPAHLAALREGSGISDEVIKARGYRTVEKVLDLVDLGFSRQQAQHAPGLLIPIWTPDGKNSLYSFRPDIPRVIPPKRGSSAPPKILKYELPKGCAVRIDCSPTCRPMLGDPSIPLWVTEGQKKADALASRGLCAIDLLGVWNFKGRNDVGGVTLLADFDLIAWNGRDVRIVFDSDVMTKRSVQQALERLKEHLQRKRASVNVVYLPQENGHKVGVDDYLLKHGIEELEGLIEGPRPQPKAAPPIIELLTKVPERMTRPLQLIGRRAFAAVWPWVQITVPESIDRQGNIVKHDPPNVTKGRRLFIVAADGRLYGDGGDRPVEELALDIRFSEIPPDNRLWSVEGIKRFRRGERPQPADVFGRIVDVVDRFIDFDRSLGDQRAMSELVACYVLATWFLDAFNVIGFLWPNGEAGSGKTQLLSIIAELGYLGQLVLAGGSYASLRDLADYGATICFDDAENFADLRKADPDKAALLLAGNRRGNTVQVKELGPDKAWRTRSVSTFCPRSFSAIRIPNNALATRTIIIPLIRTPDRYRANADPADYEVWPHDRTRLIDDLWALALANLADLPAYEAKVNEHAELTGRNLEPWKAILAVAAWLEDQGVSGIWKQMESLSVAYQSEKKDLDSGNLTVLVVRALARCLGCDDVTLCDPCDVMSETSKRIKTSDITEAAKKIAEAEELNIDVEHINSRRIGQRLAAMRFKSKREGGSGAKGWIIGIRELQRWARAHGLMRDVTSSPIVPSGRTSQPSQNVTTSHALDEDLGPESEPGANWEGE